MQAIICGKRSAIRLVQSKYSMVKKVLKTESITYLCDYDAQYDELWFIFEKEKDMRLIFREQS